MLSTITKTSIVGASALLLVSLLFLPLNANPLEGQEGSASGARREPQGTTRHQPGAGQRPHVDKRGTHAGGQTRANSKGRGGRSGTRFTPVPPGDPDLAENSIDWQLREVATVEFDNRNFNLAEFFLGGKATYTATDDKLSLAVDEGVGFTLFPDTPVETEFKLINLTDTGEIVTNSDDGLEGSLATKLVAMEVIQLANAKKDEIDVHDHLVWGRVSIPFTSKLDAIKFEVPVLGWYFQARLRGSITASGDSRAIVDISEIDDPQNALYGQQSYPHLRSYYKRWLSLNLLVKAWANKQEYKEGKTPVVSNITLAEGELTTNASITKKSSQVFDFRVKTQAKNVTLLKGTLSVPILGYSVPVQIFPGVRIDDKTLAETD